MKGNYVTQIYFEDLAQGLKDRLTKFEGTEADAHNSEQVVLAMKFVLYSNGIRNLELSLFQGNEYLRDFDQTSVKIFDMQLNYIVKSIEHAAKGRKVYWIELPRELRYIPEKPQKEVHHKPMEVIIAQKKVQVPANMTLAMAANS